MKRICPAYTFSAFAVLAAALFSASLSFAADGDYDTSFNGTGFRLTDIAPTTADRGVGIFVQADGKIVVPAFGNGRYCALRYNSDGTLDTTFDLDGIAISPVVGTAQAGGLQNDGKVIVVGNAGGMVTLFRFNTDGSPDNTFGTAGQVSNSYGGTSRTVSSVLTLSDGKIFVVGYRGGTGTDGGDIIMGRYNTDGSLDSSFGSSGILIVNLNPATVERAYDALLYPDGRILITGFTVGPDGLFSASVTARFNPDGSLDTTFGSGGFVTTDVQPGNNDDGRTVALHATGQIVVAGSRTLGELNGSHFVLRYLPDGTLDPSFDGDGIFLGPETTATSPVDTVVQAGGKAIVAYSTGEISRFNFNGSTDATFSGASSSGAARLAIQPDLKIVYTGGRTISGTNSGVVTARLTNTVGTVTAAPVNLSGRVMTSDGRGLKNAVVAIADQSGATRRVVTGTMGYYRFNDVSAGETYIVSVMSKRFGFAPKVISVTDDLAEINFIAGDLNSKPLFEIY